MNTIFVSPSYACNERCLFCPCHREARRYKPIPTHNILASIAEACRRDKLEMVLISGGEPTLYPGLPAIMQAAKGHGLKVGLLSNSLRFADDTFCSHFLQEVGYEFELTTAFHSHIPEEHDRITGVEGSFERSLRGVQNMERHGVKTTIKHVVNGISHSHLPDFAEWVNATFPPCVDWVLCHIDICGEAHENGSQTGVAFAQSRPYLEQALDVMERFGRRRVSVFNTPLCCVDPYFWSYLHRYESEEHMSALLLPREDDQPPAIQYDLQGDGGANFAPCQECIVRHICPGTWRRTAEYYGDTMFHPFKG